MFLANYGDGLSDLPLPTMLETFHRSKAVASLLLVQPTASFDIVSTESGGAVTGIQALNGSDIWINGGFFALRNEIFSHIQPGDELVREPFQRLIEKQALLAYKYTGFWQCMDTFKDKQRLEDMNQSTAPWKVWHPASNATGERLGEVIGRRMIGLNLQAGPGRALQILCLGAHSDDIEIGCGGTILRLAEEYPESVFHWVVFSANGVRGGEAQRGAELFAGARLKGPTLKTFKDGFMPFEGAKVKEVFEELKQNLSPDLIFTHNRKDAHQDHRLMAELTWNTFRNHLILEYEIPKYDGDLGQPSVFVPLAPELIRKENSTHHGRFSVTTFEALV